MDGRDSVHKGDTMEIIRKLRGLLWVDIWGYENALARIWNLLLAAFDKRDKEQVEEREKRRDVVPAIAGEERGDRPAQPLCQLSVG